MYLRSSIFCDTVRHLLVIYQHFRIVYRSHLQEPSAPRISAGEWVNILQKCSQWLADRNELWRTNGVLGGLLTTTIIWYCQPITNYCPYISMHPPAPAFFLDYLTLEDWSNTLSWNAGNKLQTRMAQHPRRAKISNTETDGMKKCWAIYSSLWQTKVHQNWF